MKFLIINKWNQDNKGYQEEEFDPGKYNLKTFTDVMNEVIHCPHCLQELHLGESYTSIEYRTPLGVGYCICYRCHQKELQRRYKN